ncbi:MAG: hypothetical protein C5B60_02510 [Chloroflexi bacterium]|nr:MAG: hypothetical protein C5B60_02510 [Chloroflexota bacterium]
MNGPEDEERPLRIELMTTQIERLRQEIRYENRKFLIQFTLAIAAAFTAGGIVGGLIVRLLSGH